MADAADALYREPPGEFVRARNALAKTMRGAEAARVRALAKPTVPAWAVNQLYWRDRAVFDRLVDAGSKLRRAEVAALEGHPSDLRAATASHRAALADAIRRTIAIAREAGVAIDSGAIAGTLEALSLSPEGVEPGRLTRPLRPAGFEALAGVRVPAQAAAHAPRHQPAAARPPARAPAPESKDPRAARAEAARHAAEKRQAVAARAAARREEAARRAAAKREAAARRTVDRAIAQAEREEQRARRRLAEAQRKIAELRLRRG